MRFGFKPVGIALAVGGLVLGSTVIVVGLGHLASTAAASPDRGRVPGVAATSVGPGSSAAAVTPPAALPEAPAAVAAVGFLPSTLTIASLHVTAGTVPVVVHGGYLDVPDDPQQLGWWAGGALPGSAAGTVVLDGHVDTYDQGAGALRHLADVAVGSVVEVAGPTGSAGYQVTGVREYPKTALPAAQTFVTGGSPRLVLITCGGAFDTATRHYQDNVVVYATPV